MEAHYQEYKDQQFIIVTLLDSGTPQAWSSMHGSNYPILEVTSDQAWVYWTGTSGQQGYPSTKTLKVGMVVHEEHFHQLSGNQIPPILP